MSDNREIHAAADEADRLADLVLRRLATMPMPRTTELVQSIREHLGKIIRLTQPPFKGEE